MSEDEKLREHVLGELRRRGVDTSELMVVERIDYVLIGGQVKTFYEHQLIQQFSNRFTHHKTVEIDVTVFNSSLPLLDRIDSQHSSAEIHQLRNRLNRLVLGLGLVKHALAVNDMGLGTRIIDELLSGQAGKHTVQQRLTNKRILVVEDDLNQCLLLSGLLRQMGARVTQRRTAESARALLQYRLTPDFLLVDLHLTGQQGTEFAHWFRNAFPNSAVTIIAVSATRPTRSSLNSSPFSDWVPKPISIPRLLNAILIPKTQP